MQLNRLLSAVAIVLVLGASVVFAVSYIEFSKSNYKDSIKYSLTENQIGFDYSCNERVYSLYLVLTNDGPKLIQNLSISVTNGICEGAVPPIPTSLPPFRNVSLHLYTNTQRGSITVSGNNTLLTIKF